MLREGYAPAEMAAAIEVYTIEDRALDEGLNAKTEDLPATLDELKKFDARPYNDELTRRRRGIVSPDPQVQRKIDKLFNDTQQVVTRFLDTSDVDRLERDMDEAKNRGKTAASGG